MAKYQSSFEAFVHDTLARGRDTLREAGWLDPASGGPDVARILPLLGPQEVALPEHALHALAVSPFAAAAAETLGEHAAARAWCELGQYGWRGGRLFANAANPPEFEDRDAAADLQFWAAVCADRAGNAPRRGQLYAWAAENYRLTAAELVEFARARQHRPAWERLPKCAYSLACLEAWREALDVATEADQWAARDARTRGGEAYHVELRILPVVAALARHHVEPSPETRRALLELLTPAAVTSRSDPDHLLGLLLLTNLRQRFQPTGDEDAELPPELAVQRGAEACVRLMGELGVRLDGSVESLQLLDRHAAEVYGRAGPDQRQALLFTWGCYVGETVRVALPGGAWELDSDDPIHGRLAWLIDDAEIALMPFQVAAKVAAARTGKSLWQTWCELAEAYRQLA